jgi:GTP-binding protein
MATASSNVRFIGELLKDGGAPRASPVDPARHGIGRAVQNLSIVAESPVPAKRSEPPHASRPSDEAPAAPRRLRPHGRQRFAAPAGGPPEVAFAGRSNAGKSSAINALANRTRLAYTSKTPGRTQQINLFRLRSGALLADLPGYGYAAVPRQLKRHWQAFLTHYLATRQSLVGLVLVVDARHGLAEADRSLLGAFVPSGRPVLVLATKMDKLAPSAQRLAQAGIARAVAEAFPAYAANVMVVSFSATRKRGVGDAERSSPGGSATRATTRWRHRRAVAERKGPAVKGSDSGPETPCVGGFPYEGTRSGRKAGDALASATSDRRPRPEFKNFFRARY